MKRVSFPAIVFAVALTASTGATAADRSRTVAGWTVSDRSEQDGGRLVTLGKSGRGWKLEHQMALWHGNGGVYLGATFRWHGCDSGEAGYLFQWDEPITTEILAQRTRDYLDECRLSNAQKRQVVRGLDQANAQAQRWVEDFRRAMAANSEKEAR